MKKYKVNSLKIENIIVPFIISCFFINVIIMMMNSNITGIFRIFPLLILLVFIAIILSLIVPTIRYSKIIKNGKKGTGVVESLNVYHSRGIYWILIFKYRDESGKEALTETQIPFTMKKYFSVGKTIPILINGKYAIHDMKRILESSRSNEDQDCEMICDNCGYKIAFGLLYCPKCGKSVEDMNDNCNDEYHGHKNYCPNCSCELSEEDSYYCSNCGYKLK